MARLGALLGETRRPRKDASPPPLMGEGWGGGDETTGLR
jgi:hypothetical protein